MVKMAKGFKLPAGSWEVRGGAVVSALMRDLKLKDFQAAGLVGGFGVESIEFKVLHEIGQDEDVGGYGWAQWTGPRRRKFFAWCEKNGLNWQSDEANYGYLVYDLTHDYKGFFTKLKRTEDIEEAAHLAHREYETPQEVLDGTETSYPARLRYAKRALAGAGSTPTPGPEPEPGPAPTKDNATLEDALFIQARVTRIIQRELGLAVDGDYGKATRDAVRRYVKEH